MGLRISNGFFKISNGAFRSVEAFLSSGGGELLTYTVTQSFTTVGSGSWTKPIGVTSLTVECWGAGGAGGAGTVNSLGGGGGGGGGYARSILSYSSNSSIIPYVVGAGGTGGTSIGANGLPTTWNSALVLAAAGAGGNISDGLNPGNGGVGGGDASNINIGDIIYQGSVGGFGGDGINPGGTGGGAAGSSGSAIVTSTGSQEFGGNGGTGYSTVSVIGGTGFVYGGGGGGGFKTSGATRSGGSGAQGFIRVSYGASPILNLNAENASSYPGTGTTWFDISGYGNDATMSGTVPFVNTSPKYFNYANTANYFVGNTNLTSSITDKITISSWIYTTDLTQRSNIFDKYQTVAPFGYNLEVGTNSTLWTNTVRFFIQGTTALNGIDARGVSNALTQGTINMVSATFDYPTRVCRLYVNGSEISFTNPNSTTNMSSDWSQSPNVYAVGSFRPDVAIDSTMRQYRLLVYNAVLSPAQILDMYNSQKSVYGL